MDREVIDYEVIRDIDLLYDRGIVIYGVGMWGTRLCELLLHIGVIPVGFAISDTNAEETYRDIKIRNYKEYAAKDNLLIILASALYWEDMLRTLKDSSLKGKNVCTMLAVFYSIHIHRKDERIPIETEKELEALADINHHKLYHYMCDYFWGCFCEAYADEDKILVYTAGKTGSRSLCAALGNKGLHIHSFALVCALPFVSRRQFDVLARRIRSSERKIITTVRDPFSRDVSCFLQNMDYFPYPYCISNPSAFFYDDYLNNKKKFDFEDFLRRTPGWDGEMEDNCQRYLHYIIDKACDEFSWFDYELKAFWGVDIYQTKFDRKKGYSHISTNNLDILVLRLENLTELRDVVRNFSGVNDYDTTYTNLSDKKMYRYLYMDIKERVTLSSEYVHYYLNNKKVEHFYTDQELKRFLSCWMVD